MALVWNAAQECLKLVSEHLKEKTSLTSEDKCTFRTKQREKKTSKSRLKENKATATIVYSTAQRLCKHLVWIFFISNSGMEC